MPNPSIWKTRPGRHVPKADTKNEAGGRAYSLSDEGALVQLAITGTFNNTFYTDARVQLDNIVKLANKVSPEFLAKAAVYARQAGFMKDTPAALLAILSKRDTRLFRKVFPQVIDNGRMLKGFLQMVRSDNLGRKSLGTTIKKACQEWFRGRHDNQMIRDMVGGQVTLADAIKLCHVRPRDEARRNLHAYILGKDEWHMEALPYPLYLYNAWKQGKAKDEVPRVPFQMLTNIPLDRKQWTAIALNGQWHQTRMNLMTYKRHGVLDDEKVVEKLAEKLKDADQIRRAKVFPYQVLASFAMTVGKVPKQISLALHEAMEIAIENVPEIPGKTWVVVDVSGSMAQPITGYRQGSSSMVSCVDVAALMASVFIKRNPLSEVMAVDTRLYMMELNPHDSVVTNAAKFHQFGGGGTMLQAPLKWMNENHKQGDLVLYISDNESWAGHAWNYGTAMLEQWEIFHSRNQGSRLVCLDLVANTTTQAPDRRNEVLNIGGFSDQVFDVVARFMTDELGDGLVQKVKEIEL